MGVLEKILARKRSELSSLRRRPLPSPPARRPVELGRPPGAPLRLIAEIKRRSPSAGELSTHLSVAERAEAYDRAGATMISVLCDEAFFDGSYEDMERARQRCRLPLLCKEFIIDECQLDAARAFGADAVLLIVRCLEADRLTVLVAAARSRALVPLVEVHTAREAALALDAGADIIGVNARNLDTLEMDIDGATQVLAGLPAAVTRLHLSGLSTPEAVARVARGRADAALIGEALMRPDDPEPLLTAMVRAAGDKLGPGTTTV